MVIYLTLQCDNRQYTFFSIAYVTFTKIDHLLGSPPQKNQHIP